MRRWLALKDLLVDATLKTTDLVQETHQSVTQRVFGYAKWVEPLRESAELVESLERVSSGVAYDGVRLGTQLAGRLLDVGLNVARQAADDAKPEVSTPMSSSAVGGAAWTRDAALGVLNGVVGDFLESRENGLSTPMSLRRAGEEIRAETNALREALPDASGKLCVFVHGLACTEWSWSDYAEEVWGDPEVNYGSLLEAEHGFSVLYVRYNSGRRIATNGRALAQLLEELLRAYPRPVDQLVLIGHSMGGLVSRSAAHYATELGLEWPDRLRQVFCIGSPHHGAPLEKAGNLLTNVLLAFDTPGTQLPGKVINARSAGIKDLRYGALLDDDWGGASVDALLDDRRRPVLPLPHVKHHFVAASVSQDPDHPVGRVLGDLLVRRGSAEGEHPSKAIGLETGDRLVLGGVTHLGLVNEPRVYAQLLAWLGEAPTAGDLRALERAQKAP
ncbi:MAG: alpha/beta fold hydrolase [Myxococcales bacterium]|nr:alpha/beta fold hydrolase [Myxococcales bacterium]